MILELYLSHAGNFSRDLVLGICLAPVLIKKANE